MQSSVWGAVPVVTAASGAGDPAAMLNSQLANALSTMGDAHFWEESIAPSTIRTSLASSDPSNPNSTPTLLRGMKWLLASISKGRNVSDFYPHVVKLVGASSLEVRKMVYMFLVQYADHDATTRELSLLSINSFQRGLADPEQLIRALALRVLTSIRVPDILQIQILGVQKCASDKSPYVRKCAANALAKLCDQCRNDPQQQQMLVDIMKKMLDTEDSTMVLSSAVIAFVEICPERLSLLHRSYRKLCNQLADMDEWGQVVVIDVMQRYCRQFFCAPKGIGSAEAIDAERRVVRTMHGIQSATAASAAAGAITAIPATAEGTTSVQPTGVPSRTPLRKIKRRVVKKGFYSDDEDESTEEEIYSGSGGIPLPVASAARQHADLSLSKTKSGNKDQDLEDDHLDEDHRLLLRTTLPLLKSRNSAVVLAVCSLHYYCGVASIRVRSSLGKALVRIHRDRREIQYVVLTSIKELVKECPSAFTPFLQDFYVKGMDPSFTRLIKLEILTLLALEPNSINAVLMELRTYIRHDDDKPFCCAAIRAVGKVAELARIVHDRHGQHTGNVERERNQANSVALNALYGLLTLTRASSDPVVVGECTIVMERILLQLSFENEGKLAVEDPNRIQESTIKRLLLLLIMSLSSRSLDGHEDMDDEEDENTDHEKLTLRIPPMATASTLWIVGEWIVQSNSTIHVQGFDHQARLKTRLELSRLIARVYPALESVEKLQSIHFASKLLVTSNSPQESAVCELILSMGRADVQVDVRDRARMESNLIHTSIGLQHDVDNITVPLTGKTLSVAQVKRLLLAPKPPTSSLPLQHEDGESGTFRFGTLSSLVNRRAKAAYLPLPKWAEKNSPSSLRDEAKVAQSGSNTSSTVGGWNVDSTKKNAPGFYDSENGKFWLFARGREYLKARLTGGILHR
jgi:AP-3 complex subunit beta